jgi:hypothetical protein
MVIAHFNPFHAASKISYLQVLCFVCLLFENVSKIAVSSHLSTVKFLKNINCMLLNTDIRW